MPRWEIPEPLQVGWKMRELSSAKIGGRELPDGRFEQTIEQAPLPGVTPEMMLWWLANMERPIEACASKAPRRSPGTPGPPAT